MIDGKEIAVSIQSQHLQQLLWGISTRYEQALMTFQSSSEKTYPHPPNAQHLRSMSNSRPPPRHMRHPSDVKSQPVISVTVAVSQVSLLVAGGRQKEKDEREADGEEAWMKLLFHGDSSFQIVGGLLSRLSVRVPTVQLLSRGTHMIWKEKGVETLLSVIWEKQDLESLQRRQFLPSLVGWKQAVVLLKGPRPRSPPLSPASVVCLLRFALCIPGSVFCVLRSAFRVSGSGFRVSGFGFWVLGFGFRFKVWRGSWVGVRGSISPPVEGVRGHVPYCHSVCSSATCRPDIAYMRPGQIPKSSAGIRLCREVECQDPSRLLTLSPPFPFCLHSLPLVRSPPPLPGSGHGLGQVCARSLWGQRGAVPCPLSEIKCRSPPSQYNPYQECLSSRAAFSLGSERCSPRYPHSEIKHIQPQSQYNLHHERV
eukprot:2018603-Rhodomonas_salina.2